MATPLIETLASSTQTRLPPSPTFLPLFFFENERKALIPGGLEDLRGMVSSLSLPSPPLPCRHPRRRTSISFSLLGLGRILAASLLFVLVKLPGADQHEGDIERDALIAILEPACATSNAKRAAIALSRMHGRGEQDADVHCWLAGVLAGAAADPDGAYKECRKAFSLSPSQSCSIYCLSHFLLWHAEWQSLEAVAPMARAAVDIELEQGKVPSLAYLEALLLLPTQTLHRLLSSRAHHLLLHQSTSSVSGQEQEQQLLLDRWWIPPPAAAAAPPPHSPPHSPSHPPSATLSPLISEGSAAAIRVVFVCAAARDHPHGRVLLDVLESLSKRRSGEKDSEMAPSSSSSSLKRGGKTEAGGGGEQETGAGGGKSQGRRRRKGGGAIEWPSVEAACIFTGPAPVHGDTTRKRIESTCVHSIQLGVVASPSQIAAAVNEGRAHVAVDVDGWAQGSHVAAMKLRPAPVSMLFAGHVGSSGVEEAHDYVFTDRVSSPPDLADAYTERLLITPLGRSYFLSSAFSTPPPRPPRSSLGLPEDGIVVSCISAVFKLSPALLDAWARLLIDSSQAVLWLPSYPTRAR